MADAIALIVAGSGETTPEEVFDLLEDAYPADAYEEVGLAVPVDKDLFTKSVQNVVKWFDADKDVYPIQTKGASLGGRAASRLGDGNKTIADRFTDILSREEFPEKDWAEVHVLIAMPSDEEDPDYEFYAEVADLALKAGFVVRDLTAGLDDIVVTDPVDADGEEPEPEKEPEKPARRRRSRAAPEADEPKKEEEKPKSTRARRSSSTSEKSEPVKDVEPTDEPVAPKGDISKSQQIKDAYAVIKPVYDALGLALEILGYQAVAAETPTQAPKDEDEAPKRGRGRPRTDFDVRQIWDEDEEEWIPRPKGRLRRGTQWRTIHADTSEVLEEGTA